MLAKLVTIRNARRRARGSRRNSNCPNAAKPLKPCGVIFRISTSATCLFCREASAPNARSRSAMRRSTSPAAKVPASRKQARWRSVSTSTVNQQFDTSPPFAVDVGRSVRHTKSEHKRERGSNSGFQPSLGSLRRSHSCFRVRIQRPGSGGTSTTTPTSSTSPRKISSLG